MNVTTPTVALSRDVWLASHKTTVRFLAVNDRMHGKTARLFADVRARIFRLR
jgi:hypothetical protein